MGIFVGALIIIASASKHILQFLFPVSASTTTGRKRKEKFLRALNNSLETHALFGKSQREYFKSPFAAVRGG